MADTDEIQQQTELIQRGNDAAIILDNPVFQEALDSLRRKNYETFCFQTQNADDDVRRGLWAKGQAIEAIMGQLEAFVHEGYAALKEREAQRLENRDEKE